MIICPSGLRIRNQFIGRFIQVFETMARMDEVVAFVFDAFHELRLRLEGPKPVPGPCAEKLLIDAYWVRCTADIDTVAAKYVRRSLGPKSPHNRLAAFFHIIIP